MLGWIAAPVITAVCCFIFLFIMQNVFSQKVFIPKTYSLSASVLNEIEAKTDVPVKSFEVLKGEKFQAGQEVVSAIKKYYPELTNDQALKILSYAEVVRTKIDAEKINALPADMFSDKQKEDITALSGKTFLHTWALQNVLSEMNPEWKMLEENILNKRENGQKKRRFNILEKVFKWE